MDMPRLMNNVSSVLLPSKYAYSGGASYAIYETVGNICTENSYVKLERKWSCILLLFIGSD